MEKNFYLIFTLVALVALVGIVLMKISPVSSSYLGGIGEPSISPTEDTVVFPGKPKIWFCDRVLIAKKENPSISRSLLNKILSEKGDLKKYGNAVDPIPVKFSCRKDVGRCWYDGSICFKNAVDIGDFILEWGPMSCDGREIQIQQCGEPRGCVLYFTGIGCPHCALTDPFLFYKAMGNSSLVLLEYEIYKDAKSNAGVMRWYIDNMVPQENKMMYMGIPQLYFNRSLIIVGDTPILQNFYNISKSFSQCRVPWLSNLKVFQRS